MTGITTQVEDATNVLLKIPPMSEGRELATSLLVGGDAAPNVLFITYTRQAAECVEDVDGESVGSVGVVTVGEGTNEVDGAVTETVSAPNDLTGLGIRIGEFLSEWDAPVHVSFDSLTSLLQYVDFETAYEFLHAITGQIHAADARAFFYIDPSAHDDQDVAGLESLFDASVSFEDEPTVRTRDLLAE